MSTRETEKPRPLDNRRERNLVPLLAGGLGAMAILIAGAWVLDKRVEQSRMAYIGRELVSAGYGAPVSVEPSPGDNCWRASEGFHWRTDRARGYACAGPRSKVVLYPDGAP